MNMTILSGSNRKNATSTKLLRYMEEKLRSKGVEVSFIDLYETPVPLYSPDSEERDVNTRRMIQAFEQADGIILGSPEYHGSISGVLKNALDYVGSAQVSGKTVLSVSSSGGAVGVSSLTHLQAIVRNVHGVNCPEWISLGGELRVFTPEGKPADKVVQRVELALDCLISMTALLRKVDMP